MHPERRFGSAVDVVRLELAIEPSAPYVNRILEGARQYGHGMSVLASQLIGDDVVQSDVIVPRRDQQKLRRVRTELNGRNAVLRRRL